MANLRERLIEARQRMEEFAVVAERGERALLGIENANPGAGVPPSGAGGGGGSDVNFNFNVGSLGVESTRGGAGGGGGSEGIGGGSVGTSASPGGFLGTESGRGGSRGGSGGEATIGSFSPYGNVSRDADYIARAITTSFERLGKAIAGDGGLFLRSGSGL